MQLARHGLVSGGSKRGRQNLEGRYAIADDVDDLLADIMFDAETSGGLMLAVPEAQAGEAAKRLEDAGALSHVVVGQFGTRDGELLVAVS